MLVELKLQPYAESDDNEILEDFDDEEWDLISDLFERLVRNFKESYPKVEFTRLDSLEKPYIYMSFQKEDLVDEEIDYYIEVLTGFTNDNIIFFDDIKYSIRASIDLDYLKEKSKEKESFLDKFNKLAMDMTPDLVEN
jgi:hypothetical protein